MHRSTRSDVQTVTGVRPSASPPWVPHLALGFRYLSNLAAMVSCQQGHVKALAVSSRFVRDEVVKLPRVVRWRGLARAGRVHPGDHPHMQGPDILAALRELPVDMHTYRIDLPAYQAHVSDVGYPRNYAAGSMSQGGGREQKLLEYFVSLDLLQVRSSDVLVDVASEWSMFPEVVERVVGARVYRQDLIYREGVHGGHIGGSATHMPLPDAFADKLVLHNAFEHFEGDADADFIREAWRVLKPGGLVCILPLFMSDRHAILTDPLVDRRGVVWDDGACVVEMPWWHNRFGRFYDAPALLRRVLTPGSAFRKTVYCVDNPEEVHPRCCLYFALVLQKPDSATP